MLQDGKTPKIVLFYICNTEQGEAMHRKYKRLKLGGSQAYHCLNDTLLL